MTITLTDQELVYYVNEIVLQANAMRSAIGTLSQALPKVGPQGETLPSQGPHVVIGAAQSAINSAMAINRLLWVNLGPLEEPTEVEKRKREWRKSRAKQLRKIVGDINQQKSPLGDRKVRNAFEHLEEYLDDYLFEIRHGQRDQVTGDMNMGDKQAFMFFDRPIVHLRFYDIRAKEVSVLDRTLKLQELVDEVERVEVLAKQWISKHQRKSLEAWAAGALNGIEERNGR
ncbi:hypothetical protein [Paenarthrobacter ureafaciens]|uniref:hypothetical protein n=1 Tax=Paenarthrobacter ureafaciens TaxID=37931 RepID=UPI001FB2B647|nr:hypothetical protein [Paenarthrobacter ureafaciens]UOD80338.1 hypothetical protein MQZ73_14615 [Paenarthrobacter ureafaciens]WNZ02991.1 hypothetical protein PVT25_15255 [Paenarthrobacter ureafaciens]